MKLIIGNKNYSSWSMRPWLVLKHWELKFEEVRIPLFTKDAASRIGQYSNAGKVPVLHDQDIQIWDSLAICEYINDHYLDSAGWPQDPKAKALARAASAEMHSGFFAIREQMPMNCRAIHRQVPMNDALQQEIRRVEQLWSELREEYQDKGPWLLGQFSIADCMFAPMASRMRTYQIPLNDLCLQYVDSVMSHPAVIQWCEAANLEAETIKMAEVGL